MCLMKSDVAVSIFAGLPNICVSEKERRFLTGYRCMQNRLIEKTQFCKGSAQGGVGHLAGVFPLYLDLIMGPVGLPVTEKW